MQRPRTTSNAAAAEPGSAAALRQARKQSMIASKSPMLMEQQQQDPQTTPNSTANPPLNNKRPPSKSFIAHNKKVAAKPQVKRKASSNFLNAVQNFDGEDSEGNLTLRGTTAVVRNRDDDGGDNDNDADNNNEHSNNQSTQQQHQVTQQNVDDKNKKDSGTDGKVGKSSSSTSDTASTSSAVKPTAGKPSSSASSSKPIVLRRRFRGKAAVLQTHESIKEGETPNPVLQPSSSSGSQNALSAVNRTVENAASLVARSPLFTTLRDGRVIDRIAEAVRWQSAAPGQYIVVAGDVANAMYFIYSGFVEILLPVSEEEETPVATLQGGDFFGEIALVSREKTLRTASILAVKPCELLVLSRDDLEGVIAVSDELRECLELEANKRLASLRQREQKILSDEVDVDRELLRKAASNPLSAIECEWRLLSKARIRGPHRSQPPPQTLPDVMAWAQMHAQHTPWQFHGRTTAALSNLPSVTTMTVSSSSAASSKIADAGDPESAAATSSTTTALLLHPEMGCVYKYSQVLDALAGPDEFDNLCRSFARLLADHLESSVLQKQAIGALALAAQIALYFNHRDSKRVRQEYLEKFLRVKIATAMKNPVHKASLSLSSETGLPTFVYDTNVLSELTAQLFKASCWSVSTQLLYEQYPKSFVLSDAWAVVTLERIVLLREECIRKVSEVAVEQMLERNFIVKEWNLAKSKMEDFFKIRRAVIRKAISMLFGLESNHRERVEKELDAESAGLWRWHECCLSFVSSKRTAQESALASQLESYQFSAGQHGVANSIVGRRGAGGADSSSSSMSFFGSARRAKSAGASATTNGFGGGGIFSGRTGVALLVAQKERMADEAIHFQKRVKMSRY